MSTLASSAQVIGRETQATFGRLMEAGLTVGRGMAEMVVAANPPPWTEDWFVGVHGSVIEASGMWYRDKHPEYSDQLVANLQVQVVEGFETRMRELAGAVSLQGGSA